MGMNNPKDRLKITATIAGAVGLFAALLLVVVSPASAAMDNPHSSAALCSKCHASAAIWSTDQGATGGICGQCHNVAGYKDAKAHTATSTYGGITMTCTSCHNPHYQDQFRTWKASSYLATGTISAVTATVLTRTGTTPLWAVDQWKDMVLVPNISYPQYNYRILNNTDTTITIDTSRGDAINLTYGKVGASFAVAYGRLIKKAINGRPVRFFQKSGPHSFADGAAVINGVTTYSVCQVCHTRAGQGAHPADKLTQDCTQCHSHAPSSSGGFMAQCDKCHGNPPTTAPGLGGTTGLASYNVPTNTIGTGSSTQGKHQKHAGTGAGDLAYACENCHSGNAMPEDATKTVDLGFDRNGKTGGNYDGQVAVTYRGNIGTIVIPKTGLKQCSNIYCHSNAKGGTPVASFATVIWDPAQAAMNCGSCHSGTATGPNYANGGAGTTTANSHNKHVVTNSFGCQKCHTQTTTDGTTIRTDVTPAKHVNANVQDVFFDATNPSGAYTTGTQTCTNLNCHNNGNTNRGATPASTNAVWGATPACGGCHGNQAGKTHPVYASGGQATATANTHVKHVETSSLSCDFCHYTTTTDTTIPPTTIVPAGTHRNGLETVSFKSVGGKTGTYTDLTATCATTYCHGAASPIWGGAAIACNGCHNASSVLVGRHSTHYASTTVATDRTAANTSSGTAYLYNCGVCHNAATHAGNPISANQPAQVVFDATIAGGGTYSAGTLQGADAGFNWTNGTCSSTYCHSNGAGGAPNNTTFTWATLAGTFTCESCHNYNAAATNKMASGNHTEHINNAAVIATNYGCQECHNRTTTDGTSITNEANHVNGAKNVSIVKGGAWLSPNCTSAYCHSTGQATPTAVNPPAWGSVTDLTCDGCHGTEGGATYGEPRYANGTQPAVVENNDNSHPAHVTVAADCARCHTDTVDAAGTAIKAASTLHTNQTRNVNFAAAYDTNGGTNSDNYNAGTKTCSAISCHGAGTPMWGGASLKCGDCHLTATAQADVDNFNFSDGTAAKISLDEWRYSGHGKTSLNYDVTSNAAANLQAAAGTGDECLYCHDGVTFNHADAGNPFRLRNFSDVTFGKNGNCLKCHATTGGTGVDPDGAGTTYANKTATKKVDKYHFGNQHSASAPELDGGQFCWDCHDPHGDRTATGGPIIMVQRNPALVSNAATSVPTATSGTAVVFTARAVAGDFANSTTGNGVCNVCHTRKDTTPNKMVHWYNQAPYTNDNHNSGTVCTQCHKHSADTVYNGDAYKGGGCNGCHDYDTRVGFNWGDGFTGQAVEGFGAHKKHIDHIKARFAPLTLDPNLDQFGLGAAAQVCGTCHTNTVGNHTTDGSSLRLINFGDGTYKEGGAAGFSFLFDPAATAVLPATLPRPQYNGVVGTSSSVNPKSCSAVGCHFQTTPVWNTY